MTIDTYTVTGTQIRWCKARTLTPTRTRCFAASRVTIDKSGTVSIRGGFAFEAAYEFEGIDYTAPTANLQNTLQNISNFGLLNGVGSVQLIPGGGDATHGNTGTGLVLFTAKHGTYPFSFTPTSSRCSFRTCISWGWSEVGRPCQRLSNYAGTLDCAEFQYGAPGSRRTRWAPSAPTPPRWAARSTRTWFTTRRRF